MAAAARPRGLSSDEDDMDLDPRRIPDAAE
jgi:hypothetical protein